MFTLNHPYCVGRSHKRIKAILPDDAFEKWRLVIDTPWRLKRHEDSNAFAFESVDPRQSRRISYKAPSQLPEGTKDKGRMKKVCGSWPENIVFVATWTRTRAVEKNQCVTFDRLSLPQKNASVFPRYFFDFWPTWLMLVYPFAS